MIMRDLKKTEIYKAANIINLYDIEDVQIGNTHISKSLLECSNVIHTHTYNEGKSLDIILDVQAVCPKCKKGLLKSDLPEYKFLCEHCDENFYNIEVGRYMYASKTSKEALDREMKVIEAIWNHTITFSNEGEGDIVCHIGDYWFYFYEGELDPSSIDTLNIHHKINILNLATMIREAIENSEDSEYEYYCSILGWEVA